MEASRIITPASKSVKTDKIRSKIAPKIPNIAKIDVFIIINNLI